MHEHEPQTASPELSANIANTRRPRNDNATPEEAISKAARPHVREAREHVRADVEQGLQQRTEGKERINTSALCCKTEVSNALTFEADTR